MLDSLGRRNYSPVRKETWSSIKNNPKDFVCEGVSSGVLGDKNIGGKEPNRESQCPTTKTTRQLLTPQNLTTLKGMSFLVANATCCLKEAESILYCMSQCTDEQECTHAQQKKFSSSYHLFFVWIIVNTLIDCKHFDARFVTKVIIFLSNQSYLFNISF